MTTPDTAVREHWQRWLDRWDAQQTGYIADREERIGLMLDLVEAAVGTAPVIVDLASGPGSISQRALQRWRGARSVAVDADVALLHIGRGALGDHDGRLRWVEADLRHPGWADRLDAALADLGVASVDAVLSATATHWLDAADLGPIYTALRQRLRPGGVYVNADHMPLASTGGLAAAYATVRDARRSGDFDHDATDHPTVAGAETWEQWWAALAEDPDVGPEIRAREHIGSGHVDVPTAADHIAALRAAGFDDVRTLTQDFDSRVLAAS